MTVLASQGKSVDQSRKEQFLAHLHKEQIGRYCKIARALTGIAPAES